AFAQGDDEGAEHGVNVERVNELRNSFVA
ncbi:MAG: hypothetical protein RIR99_550, partial [Actinomycetota bacterium]